MGHGLRAMDVTTIRYNDPRVFPAYIGRIFRLTEVGRIGDDGKRKIGPYYDYEVAYGEWVQDQGAALICREAALFPNAAQSAITALMRSHFCFQPLWRVLIQ